METITNKILNMSENGHLDVAKYCLISKGVNVHDFTLRIASYHGNLGLVKYSVELT